MEDSGKVAPTNLPLSIVYEDEDILVVYKPAGLPMHPSHDNSSYSLANAVAWYYRNAGPFVFRCTNRLDRDTSGLTVIAKHPVSASVLGTMVKAGAAAAQKDILPQCTHIHAEGADTIRSVHAPSGSETLRKQAVYTMEREYFAIVCVSGMNPTCAGDSFCH